MANRALFLPLVALSVSIPRLAAASGVAYPDGHYARVVRESVVVVRDEDSSLEELLVRAEIETDAPTLAYVMATTADVVAAPTDSAALDAVRTLARRPAAPLEIPGVDVANVALDTLKRPAGDEVDRWLRDHGFSGEGPVAAWAKASASEGRALTFVRASDPTAGRHVVRLPALRFALHTSATAVPYADADLDLSAHAAYLKRAGLCPSEPCRGPLARAFDLFVIAPGAARLPPRASGGGPSLTQALQVGGELLPVIGGLRFPLSSRWTITQYEDASLEHDGDAELSFEVLGGAARPRAKQAAPMVAHGGKASVRAHRTRGLFTLLGLLLAVTVGATLRLADEKRRG
ncbi:MAG: hypothetical protein U0235_18465 [Polyangiaceae bacterium]